MLVVHLNKKPEETETGKETNKNGLNRIVQKCSYYTEAGTIQIPSAFVCVNLLVSVSVPVSGSVKALLPLDFWLMPHSRSISVNRP